MVVARDRIEERHRLLAGARRFRRPRPPSSASPRGTLDSSIALDALGRVLDQVDDVVELVRERQDVLAVDRRIERAVGADEDLPRRRRPTSFSIARIDAMCAVDAPPAAARPCRAALRAASTMQSACSQNRLVKLFSGGISRLKRLSAIGFVVLARGVRPIARGAGAGTPAAAAGRLPRRDGNRRGAKPPPAPADAAKWQHRSPGLAHNARRIPARGKVATNRRNFGACASLIGTSGRRTSGTSGSEPQVACRTSGSEQQVACRATCCSDPDVPRLGSKNDLRRDAGARRHDEISLSGRHHRRGLPLRERQRPRHPRARARDRERGHRSRSA